jgi:DNA-binding LacI/PurR family transcriptional regulator
MNVRPTTMREVARDLGLDRATVSLVVNGHAKARGISIRTVERVNAYLRETGFVPSREAVMLRTGQRSRTGILHFGHLFTHLTMGFNSLTEAIAGGDQVTEVVIKPRTAVLEGLREMASRGVGRLVWIQSGMTWLPDGEERMEALQMGSRLRPVVYNFAFGLDKNEQELLDHGFNLVGVSRRAGFRQMAAFLHGLGHRRVLLADVMQKSEPNPLSPLGRELHRAMAQQGICVEFNPGVPPPGRTLVEMGRAMAAALAPLLSKRPAITALCFRDDEVAAGVMTELISRGVRIPRDLTVVSMDGHPLGEVFSVPLTTLAIPVDSMVSSTLRLVGSEGPAKRIRLRFRLVERASHGPACPQT